MQEKNICQKRQSVDGVQRHTNCTKAYVNLYIIYVTPDGAMCIKSICFVLHLHDFIRLCLNVHKFLKVVFRVIEAERQDFCCINWGITLENHAHPLGSLGK